VSQESISLEFPLDYPCFFMWNTSKCCALVEHKAGTSQWAAHSTPSRSTDCPAYRNTPVGFSAHTRFTLGSHCSFPKLQSLQRFQQIPLAFASINYARTCLHSCRQPQYHVWYVMFVERQQRSKPYKLTRGLNMYVLRTRGSCRKYSDSAASG